MAPPVLSAPGCPRLPPGLGAKTRHTLSRICLDLSGAPFYETATQHCVTLGSFYVSQKNNNNTRLVYRHTAIEQRYGCTNRTRIDSYYLSVLALVEFTENRPQRSLRAKATPHPSCTKPDNHHLRMTKMFVFLDRLLQIVIGERFYARMDQPM